MLHLDYIGKKEPVKLTEAVAYCTGSRDTALLVHKHIVTPNTAEANINVQQYMKKLNLGTAWIGISASKHSPRWIVGNEGQSITNPVFLTWLNWILELSVLK